MLRRLLAVGVLATLCVPTVTAHATTNSALTAERLKTVRLMNYYPSSHGWEHMWLDWDRPAIDADFGRMAGIGANTVRLIVQPKAFGYPTPSRTMTSRLDQTISMAAAHGLKVLVTLFDLWSTYLDLEGSRSWARQMVARYAGDTRLSSVELQNEIDTFRPAAAAWSRAMVPF